MGMPVKLSDELVQLAREEAKAADRSITAQIEHWASLGRSLENALRHQDLLALKTSGGDLDAAFADIVTQRAVLAVLNDVAAGVDPDVARALKAGRVVYQSDPSGSGDIMRIETNGRRTLGRFENRRFVAVDEGASRNQKR